MAGRVLVVDDEEGIRVLCRVNLELGGYEVVEAEDGIQALEQARATRPDLIFLDLAMPRMDGWEVLQGLKEDPATASIPVVLLTAKTSEEDQMKGWSEGILEYLPKPFNPQLLVEWAGRALIPRDPGEEDARRRRILEQLRLVRQLRREQ
ncbi:MAG: phosphoserine phosphatase RsbU/P [Actinomycetota bacterium]|jgi:DNA-binding response OmpR family regulator|nr:phosphoserine phosphatase RsbU/P [Actinomycetota bacterium]